MKTVAEIQDAFGGVPAFCRFFDIPRPTGHTWRRRNFIDPAFDVRIVEEAQRRKIKLSYEDLARIRAEKDVA